MTGAELIRSWRGAVLSVLCLKNCPWYWKILLIPPKLAAILGYEHGKQHVQPARPRGSALRTGKGSAPGHIVADSSRQVLPPSIDKMGFPSQQRLAVVVPVYATAAQQLPAIRRSLLSIVQQQRIPDLLILVDDASLVPVETCAAALPFPSKHVIVLRKEVNAGPAAARNAGFATAVELGAAVVCFLDDDCWASATWTAVMEQAQRRQPGIVCGQTQASSSSSIVGMFHNTFGTLNGRQLKATGELLYGCTCNMSVSTQHVRHLFDSSFPAAAYEDVDFCLNNRAAGVSLTYHPAAIVQHSFQPGLRGIFKQFRRYGAQEHLVLAKHRDYLHWLEGSDEIPAERGAETWASSQRQPPRLLTSCVSSWC